MGHQYDWYSPLCGSVCERNPFLGEKRYSLIYSLESIISVGRYCWWVGWSVFIIRILEGHYR